MNVTFGALIFVAKWAVTRKNPLKKERGMDFWFDMIDWLAIPMNMLGRRRS
jgi:2-polyprenyl-6-hydroxyphenyl methylase/3-demethylubiquinone-9 3-methyltransferase